MDEPRPERTFGYPAGYRDPEWRTDAEFRDVVLPARAKALERSINEAFSGILPEGMRFEWTSGDDPAH